MKRALFFLLLAFAAGAGAAAAQDAGAPSLDVRLGWVRSGLAGQRVMERDGLSGASLDVALALRLTPRFSLQPELQLLQKGASIHESWMGVAGGDTIIGHLTNPLRLFYVEVPVLARFELSARPLGARPYLSAGPYFAWLLHCSSYLVANAASAGGTVFPAAPGDSVAVGSACIHDGTRRPELGAAAGAGVRLPLGRLTGVADLRYEQGLSSVVKGLWGDAHNRAISATLGLSLPLGGGSGARAP